MKLPKLIIVKENTSHFIPIHLKISFLSRVFITCERPKFISVVE